MSISELSEEVRYAPLPEDFMNQIEFEIYPALFSQIQGIRGEIDFAADKSGEHEIERRMIKNLTLELRKLFNQEKFILFPFLSLLIIENKKSDSCLLFKNVKRQFAFLLARNRAFLRHVDLKNQSSMMINPPGLRARLLEFERELISSQLAKEKYLFSLYKGCGGCKLLRTAALS